MACPVKFNVQLYVVMSHQMYYFVQLLNYMYVMLVQMYVCYAKSNARLCHVMLGSTSQIQISIISDGDSDTCRHPYILDLHV